MPRSASWHGMRWANYHNVTGALESVLYVDDLGLAIAKEYPHHVEAQRLEELRSPILEVSPSQGADGGLFAGGDGFEWMSESGSSAHLDFNEDQDVSVLEDQVQLPVAGPVVALEEDVALSHQVAQRELFAPRAGELVAQGPTPA